METPCACRGCQRSTEKTQSCLAQTVAAASSLLTGGQPELAEACELTALHWAPGDRMDLFGAATLLRLGGHFPGSAVLHWGTEP